MKVKQQSLKGMALLSLEDPQITKVQLDLQLETESDGQQGDEGKTNVIHRETDVIEIKKRLRWLPIFLYDVSSSLESID